jgi:hypothetical protein
MLGISYLAENWLASTEGLCFMELASWTDHSQKSSYNAHFYTAYRGCS